MKKKTGRPRRYAEETETRALHLPTRFWAFLARRGGSRTQAFIDVVLDDKATEKVRKILKRKK